MSPNPLPMMLFSLLCGTAFLLLLGGFFVVQPRTQVVVLFFGKYVRTIVDDGISWVFPVGRQLYRLSAQVTSIELPRMMVLEANGNPIEVAAVVQYRVREAKKAALEVESPGDMVRLLASAVVKNVCSQFPYASDDPSAACLRKESSSVSEALEQELQELVQSAGIEVLQVRLNDLAYAAEIAQSMLQRQQAVAMVEARHTIVEGAVGIVTQAVQRMHETSGQMDADSTEQFASNLMMVLCSGEHVQTTLPLVQAASSHTGARQ